MLQVAIDTNVLLAGLHSPRGVSYQIIRLMGQQYFEMNISIPLMLEYESVIKRYLEDLPIDEYDVFVASPMLIKYTIRGVHHCVIRMMKWFLN